jgi:hypothetical protein
MVMLMVEEFIKNDMLTFVSDMQKRKSKVKRPGKRKRKIGKKGVIIN